MQLTVDGRPTFVYAGAQEHRTDQSAVVFVHGAGLDHTVWVLPSRYFSRHGFNVLAPDLPGHGRSAGDAFDQIETMADWIVAMLDASDIQQAAIVGHSMGSLVALASAGRHPSRYRSLCLIGSAIPMSVTDTLMDCARDNDHTAIEMLTYWGYATRYHLGGNENPGMWMIGGTLRLWEQTAPGVLHRGLQACHAYEAGITHARAVRCPTLLLLGERDIMTPVRYGRELASEIEGARTTIFKGSAHHLMTERPDEILDALISIV
mgnify:CR=1 FL=1|jgi:pimeloyl-ACP methyl ester carboxylesterase